MNSIYGLCIVAAVAWSVAAKSTWHTRLDGRIVGGRDTWIEKHPHQVSVQLSRGGNHHCGGSILSSTVIVSAAHCFGNIPTENIHIRAGTTIKENGGVVIKVKEVILHEHYHPILYNNDVAILKLSEPLPFSAKIQPIALPGPSEILKVGERATTTGWGRLIEGGTIPNILQEVDVPIISNKNCNLAYENTMYNITDRMVCASEEAGGKDACQGDSGGPLLVNKKLHGIVSWGIGCADPSKPGVYTRVTSLRSWIRSKTGL